MSTPKQGLEREVTRFREWADAHVKAHRVCVGELRGGWDWCYDDWQSLYDAVRQVFDAVPCSDWDEETVLLLLFALARDNEDERIAEDLARRPESLLILAQASLRSNEEQAKWQIAVQLARMSERLTEARSLLESLVRDNDEYVRRCALMSLGIVGSPMLEALVDAAWATEDEYQRMAALTALRDSRSPRLDDFLARAELSGQAYLLAHAARIRAGEL